MGSKKIIVFVAIFVTYLIPNNLVLAAAAAPSGEQLWQIELANGSFLSLDESDILILANVSDFIGGMIRIRENIDPSQALTLDNIRAFGQADEEKNTIHLDKIQLSNGQFITPRDLLFLIQMIRLLVSNEVSKSEKIKLLIETQLESKSPIGNVRTIVVLLDVANALNIPQLLDFCVDRLKVYLTSPAFLQLLVGNNDALSTFFTTSGLSELPTELVVILQNSIASDQVLVNFSNSLWQLQKILRGHTDRVTSVAFSSDGQALVSGALDSTVKVWDASNGKLVFTLHDHSYPITAIAVSPDRPWVVAGSHRDIIIWSILDSTLIKKWFSHDFEIVSLAFSPNGQVLASGSEDGTVKLWKMPEGTLLHTLRTPLIFRMNNIVFSQDGQQIAVSVGGTVELWNVESGTLTAVFRNRPTYHGIIEGMALSPNGRLLILGVSAEYGDNAGYIEVWDMEARELINKFLANTNSISTATLSPDGRLFAFGSIQGTVTLWDVENDTLINALCSNPALIINSLVFSPNGKQVAFAVKNNIELWRSAVDLSKLNLYQLLLLFAQARHFSGFTIEQEELLNSIIPNVKSIPKASRQKCFLS